MTNITTGISATSELSISAPELTVIDGQVTTTSLQVAQHFGKAHRDVLKAIRNIISMMPIDHQRNFAQMVVENQIGSGATRQDPAYRITRYGFSLLAMGFTGKEAFQWKLTFLDTFERMEAELVKIESRPMLVSLTITPAQAQHLRELVQLVVESGKQGHGETWNRLHRKMKVNSYLSLRPDQFEAACQYLHGKFDDTSIAAIAAKHFPQLAQLPAPQQQQFDMQIPMTQPTLFLVEISQQGGFKTIKSVSQTCLVVEPDDLPEMLLRNEGNKLSAEQRRKAAQFACIGVMVEVSRIELATEAGRIQSSLEAMHTSDLLQLEKSMWSEIGARTATYQPALKAA